MKVAILGAGAAAFALAVVLCQGGHQPVLWSPSGKRTEQLRGSGTLTSHGIIEGTFPVGVAESCEEALGDADIAIVALPAMGHRMVFDAMVPHLRDGQVVIVSSHASLGALYLEKALAASSVRVPIVAWSTTLLRSRQTATDAIRIATLRKRVDIASLPAAFGPDALEVCQSLFGERFSLRSDLLAVSLSNINAQSHMALCLCNFTRMELGEEWDQAKGSTEAVARLSAALDEERLAVAGSFGVNVRSLREHREQTYGASLPAPPKVVTYGPKTTETRYTLEDVPFGLLPLSTLAAIANVPVPLHEAGIRMFSILYGRDLPSENDLLPALKIDSMQPDEFHEVCRDGFAEGAT